MATLLQKPSVPGIDKPLAATDGMCIPLMAAKSSIDYIPVVRRM